VPCAYSVFADKIVVLVAYTDDFIADLVTCARNFAATFTTARGSAMLPILMAASMEHEDTADRLRAGFSTPLQETVQARMLPGHINEATAQGAADAIVGDQSRQSAASPQSTYRQVSAPHGNRG
jgi:hypothetical protein